MNVRPNSSHSFAINQENDINRTRLSHTGKREKIVTNDGSGENTLGAIHCVADVGQHFTDERDNRV